MNLNQYIRGQRKGKEINRLEKEAMRNAFLADAMGGYDKIKGKHERRITSLRNRISLKTKQKSFVLRYWSMAAGIFLLLGIGGLFFFQNPDFQTINQEIVLEEKMLSEIPIETNAIILQNEISANKTIYDENGKKINGTVKLSFSVDENGQAYGIVVVKSLAPAADAEAIRLVDGFLGWGNRVEEKKINVKFK